MGGGGGKHKRQENGKGFLYAKYLTNRVLSKIPTGSKYAPILNSNLTSNR